jgi:hypothetical protein
MGFTVPAFAAPIDLGNDTSTPWADNPDCKVRPEFCTILIFGAPRLVPNMSNSGDLVSFFLDFETISVSNDFVDGTSNITLNIADANGNEVFRPGGNVPLQLTYFIPVSDPHSGGTGLLPATDLTVKLGSFNDFALLPPGDLLFTVSITLGLELPFSYTFENNPLTKVATLTVSGPGTVVVPEPSTLSLVLTGLAAIGLRARKRRFETD